MAAALPGLLGVLGMGYLVLGASKKGFIMLGCGGMAVLLLVVNAYLTIVHLFGDFRPYEAGGKASLVLYAVLYVEALVGTLRLSFRKAATFRLQT